MPGDTVIDRLIGIYNSAPDARARGRVLRAWRLKAGFTQAAAAKAVGLSTVMVCLSESGDRNMSEPYVRALLGEFLEVSSIQLTVQRMTPAQRKQLAAQVATELVEEEERAVANE